jgi:pimeloyl-ACP methyl ester carboxylesterase
MVADAAGDVAAVLDTLGIGRFVVAGASGGGPHALACAARMPGRVAAAATFASPAPYTGDGAWFAGMRAPGALRAAARGRGARACFAETDAFDESVFTGADWDALNGEWGAVGRDAGAAEAGGPDGLIDDDVAFTVPWGFDLGAVRVPVLVVQGAEDRVIPRHHGERLAAGLPDAELRLLDGEGHVSVLRELPAALDWLLARAQIGGHGRGPPGHAGAWREPARNGCRSCRCGRIPDV